MNGRQQADALGFHLMGIALTWYMSLENEVKQDWAATQVVFLQRFRVSQQALWRAERDLYQCQQLPGQSIAVFTAVVLNTARRLQLTEMQKVCIIMGGLHASVLPFVEQSQPQTIQELLQCPAALSAMAAPTRADVSQNQIATVAAAIEERIVAQLQTNERHRIHDRSPCRSYRMF
ncbi:hypothetical protein LSAT2_004411 [Lamellibrachia satsuma]|nr:hypothetical protein LSAT2_004411 [Lamellibrachia satsuma]